MALTSGMRVGPFEIAGLLGAGGMGEVYRAHDATLNRDVALKVLPEGLTADAERLARFRREAQVLASLNHPNIAAIYGFEQSGGVHALVLELVEGPTLADNLAHGPVALDEAVPIARQIADALEAAHDQGVIHRDLKPANIKVRPDGTVKVLDFGLAKALEPAGGGADATASPTITTPAMTRVGMILGTAAYMSPEQAKGRTADRRSDVWAFGCVLYEMLTGKRAFDGEGVTDTLAAVLRGEPDWAALPADLPPALRALVQRCLEKDRGRRIGDLAAALFVLDQPASAAQAAASARPERRRKFALAIAAAVLLTAALVGAAAWRFRPAAPAPSVARFSFTLPEGQRPSGSALRVMAISPDGTQLVYQANNRWFHRSLAEFEARAIVGVDVNFSGAVFSPDGRSVAFHSAQDRVLKRVAVSGGAPATVCPADLSAGRMSWDSSGIVFLQRANGIFRCPANGGMPERLASLQEGELAYGPQLLLDGAALLFSSGKESDALGGADPDLSQVVVQDVATGTRKTVIDGGFDARYLPTGHLVYVRGGVLFAVPFDPAAQAVTGEAVPVVEGVRLFQFAISDTGTLVYVPGVTGATTTDYALGMADRAGTLTRLTVRPGPYGHVRASRDGNTLAVNTDDGREAIVWIYQVAGTSAMRRLTFGGQNRYPIWSPDGRRVAFQSDREGDLGLFAQNADGTGAVERLTTAPQGEAHVPESWSPDGRFVLLSLGKGNRFSLQLLSLTDRKIEPFGGVESFDPIGAVFSPDGRWVAYTSADVRFGARSANRGVYVQPFPATGARYQVPKQQSSLDFHPVWSPQGTELLYVARAASGQMASVSVRTQPTFGFGNPVNFPAAVTAGRGTQQMRAHDVLPDGRFIGPVPPTESNASGSGNEIRVVLNWFEELKARVPASR